MQSAVADGYVVLKDYLQCHSATLCFCKFVLWQQGAVAPLARRSREHRTAALQCAVA